MAVGVTSLRISMSSDSPATNYNFDTYSNPSLTNPISISYLDRTEDVAVTQVRYSGVELGNRLYQAEGVGYNAQLYNSRITYNVDWLYSSGNWLPPRLRAHMSEIASELGLSLNFRVDDNFQVPCNEPLVISGAGTEYERRYETHTGTVSELIDRLIGWSRDVPTKQYAVRIYNNTLNIIQRGDENGTVDLDSAGAIRRDPVFTKRLVNTLWNGSGGYIYSSANSLTKEPFTGTISFGTNPIRTLNYTDGYLMSEVLGNTTTTYTYSQLDNTSTENARYLLQKVVTDTDSYTRITTSYEYSDTTNEKYLSRETELHEYSTDNGTTWLTEKTITTEHAPLGNSWFGTTTTETYPQGTGDDAVVSTSLGQGAPGGKVSQYMVDSQQEGLTDNADINQRREAISGVARIRATYPIYDINTLRTIARAIDNYNGATEYTCSMDVYGLTSVVDIDDKVIFGTVSWHVTRNEVEITPRGTVQHLSLIRWVL